MKLFEIINTKSIVQDIINCWLQYVLAQPIEIDIRILSIFMLQYIGFTQLVIWMEKISPLITSAMGMSFTENVPVLERA